MPEHMENQAEEESTTPAIQAAGGKWTDECFSRYVAGRIDIGAPACNSTWLITFADLCTLLLTFFVLLFSMSSLNERAFRSTFQSHKGLGTTNFDKEVVSNPRELVLQDLRKTLEGLRSVDIRDLSKVAKDSLPGDGVISMLVPGTAIYVHRLGRNEDFSLIVEQELLFHQGDATLDPASLPLLETLARVIIKGHYHCYIDGHTDDGHVQNERFGSNDELALARAAAVLDFFVSNCQVEPALLAIGGYGDSHPLADSKPPEMQAMNRRVELIFRKDY